MNITLDTTRFIYEVLENHEYSFMFDDLVVMDLGCNVGAFSFWIYPRASVIHAVDLAPKNIDMLNQTIKENNLGKIKTYCYAIAGNTGIRLAKDPSYPGEGAWMLADDGDLKVDAFTLSDFMKQMNIPRIDVLKIDIEGGEYEVLGLGFPKIPVVIGEYHRESLKNAFNGLGYSYYKDLPGNHFIARL